jgi:hypothetical protein
MSSKRKSNFSSARNNNNYEEGKPISLQPIIKLIAAEEIIEISRNKPQSVLLSSDVSHKQVSLNILSKKDCLPNLKTKQFNTRNRQILNDLFDDEYLKENEYQIQKYSKKSVDFSDKITKPSFSTFNIYIIFC